MRHLVRTYLQARHDSHLATAATATRLEDLKLQDGNSMPLLSKSLKIDKQLQWRFHRFTHRHEKYFMRWSRSARQIVFSQSWLARYQLKNKAGGSNKIRELIATKRLSIIGTVDPALVRTVPQDEHCMKINNRVKRLEPVTKHNKSLGMQLKESIPKQMMDYSLAMNANTSARKALKYSIDFENDRLLRPVFAF